MKELITPNWRASNKTISTLKAAGWSDEQRKRKLLLFIERYGGKEISGASSKYNAWVKEETPRDAPQKPDDTKEIIDTKATDLKNKSKDGKQRAREAKQQAGVLTQEQAINEYQRLRSK